MDVSTFANANSLAFLFRCTTSENFVAAIYPLLQQVQSRGVQVINIAGDVGQQTTEAEFTTSNGMVLLGSGITAETPYNEQFPTADSADKVLILHHDLSARELTWEFREV